MKNVIINIDGKQVTLQDLQYDVASAERKGYGYQYAFTLYTVQGLINKISELSDKRNMFIFSEPHMWQGEPAVHQILVFTSDRMQRKFEEEMKKRFKEAVDNYSGIRDENLEKLIESRLSDSNAGAIYKLRSVLNGEGTYNACLRCGFTGVMIREDQNVYATHKLALEASFRLL